MSRYIPPGDPEVVYISRRHVYKSFDGTEKPPLRYANLDFASPPKDVIYQRATVKGDVILRETPAGRRNLRATFSETDRRIHSLDINHYTDGTGSLHPTGSVTLHGAEIDVLENFIQAIKRVKLLGTGKLVIEPGALEHERFVSDEAVASTLKHKPELLREIMANPQLSEDLKALGYWRKGLERFQELLEESDAFNAAQASAPGRSAERVWQDFFESNSWIFGYGLLHVSTEGVSKDKLQKVLKGGSVLGGGSTPDALLKTRGAISNLCLVELKLHYAPLVASDRRGGSNLISKELSDAVSQCQTAIRAAEDEIDKSFQPTDDKGFPAADPIFNMRPRSILVIGNLSEFRSEHGISVDRFRCFEMYRRNLHAPEVITYDELFDRARSIVAMGA